MNDDNVINFESSRAEHFLKGITEIIGSKNITTNIYRIQAKGSIMCGYFRNGFIDFKLKG